MKYKPKIIIFSACLLMFAVFCCWGCSSQQQPAQSAPNSSENETSQNADFTWSADADCSVCHITQVASQSDSQCIASLHSDLQCTDCHSDVEDLSSAHENATAEKAMRCTRLENTSINEDYCFSCHGSWSSLAEKTASCVALTDTKGTTVNPHDIPTNVEHEDITCSSCHKMHSAIDIDKNAMDFCTSCHHQNEFTCFTCHA